MKAIDLYPLMEDPSLLSKETVDPLRQLVDEYPYFHIARMLYLKNLAIAEDANFMEELKRMAVFVPDRKKLFTLIEGDRYGISFSSFVNDAPKTDSFSLIDAFLSDGKDEESGQGANELQPSVSGDYIYWSLTNEGKEEEKETEPSAKLKHQDLIDAFIESDAARGRRLPQNESPSTPLEEEPQEEMPTPSPDDDSYFTETLAHIYIKQKRYEKALPILRNLYLNYPKKNVYFADQIRFLEKLIINTKK
jgi:hypothetical protein